MDVFNCRLTFNNKQKKNTSLSYFKTIIILMSITYDYTWNKKPSDLDDFDFWLYMTNMSFSISEKLTCYTCVNVSDNLTCNQYAIDRPCARGIYQF